MAKLLVSLAGIAAVASSQAFLVDDFTSGSYNSGYISSGSVLGWTAATVPGGIRGTFLDIQNNPLGNDARLRVQSSFGVFQVSTESSVDSLVQIAYGFANNSTTLGSNDLNLDLSIDNLLKLSVRSNDIALPSSVTLFTNSGTSPLTRSLVIPGGIVPSSASVFTFDFSADAASLTDVDAIVFQFDGAPDGDYSFSSIEAVPEPATVAVMGMGVAALLRRRRK